MKVTPEQTETIKKMAKEVGLPMTSFLRYNILKIIKDYPQKEVYAV